MKTTQKLKVMVLFGGRSGEHEVSLRSAASVIQNLDPNKYEVVPVGIDKKGKWHLHDVSFIEKETSLTLQDSAPEVLLAPYPESEHCSLRWVNPSSLSPKSFDVVFPVMHGPLCEDGTIQGFLELADLPYIGSGVLSSAVSMDKDVAKRLIEAAGLPIVPYICLKPGFRPHKVLAEVEDKLGYPVFVKPANLGSSVGVQKVKDPSQLEKAIENAFQYDVKVLVEKAVAAREIEFSVLESKDSQSAPRVSVAGEIIPSHEFYSYEAKYIDEGGAALSIPAHISDAQMREGQVIAQKSFQVLGCEGLARVDLFLDKETQKFYFNEVNTLPGFTSISMYPKLWAYSGLPYSQLLDELIELALSRHAQRSKLVRDFHVNQ